MKNIRRILCVLLVAMVTLSALALMVSCGGDDETPAGSTQSSQTGNTNPSTNSSSTGGSSQGGTTGSSDQGGESENPNLVKVTVVDEKGNPVNGAVVQICQGESCFATPIKTGANGVGTREYGLNGDQLKAKINSITGNEDFLASDAYVYFPAGARSITIVVRKVTVDVFDQTDKAVEGAAVQLKDGEYSFSDVIYTDADGVAYAYIAVTGNEISATVTEVLSGAYKVPSEEVFFGIGVYEQSLTVNKLLNYTVKVSTLMGQNLANAKVELFNASNNRKQKTLYTDENGIVVFENLADGEYYVKVSHESPAYVISTVNDEGKFYFTDGETSISVTAVEIDVNYQITLSSKKANVVVYLYSMQNELVASGTTDENGVATITAPSGDYFAYADTIGSSYITFTRHGTAMGELAVNTSDYGSDSNPVILVGSVVLAPTVDTTYSILIPNPMGKQILMTTQYGNSSIYQLDELNTENKEDFFVWKLKIEKDIVVTITRQTPGTESCPYEAETGMVVEDFGDNRYVYYTYTAPERGSLIIDPNGNVMYMDGMMVDGKYIYPMNGGDTVTFYLSTVTDDYADYDEMPSSVVVYLSFEQYKVDYEVNVNVENGSAEGITVTLYAKYGDTLYEQAKVTTNSDGVAFFEELLYLPNYVVKVEYPDGYTSLEEEISLGLGTYTSVYLIQIRTGKVDLPFDFNVAEGKENVTVSADETVWYSIFIRPNFDGTRFSLVANNANVVFTVYLNDTNGDGVVDSSDTPVGTSVSADGKASFTFPENDKLYKIAVTVSDGASLDFEVEFVSTEGKEGSGVDKAIEITESGEFTATVEGSDVYYVITEAMGNVTVTLTGEANLQLVTFDMGGNMSATDAENNTFTVDAQGNWVYFIITSQTDGEYSFTVTIEE